MHLTTTTQARRQRGVSLIEVLVAILIFSLGLIGLAGLLVMASQSNHSSYLRTQASFLAGNMADRMRANPVGIWNGNYDATDYPVTSADKTCGAGTPCTPSDLANHDKANWSRMLVGSLPNTSASIQCTPDGSYTPSAEAIRMRPPYSGYCTMRITWSERGIGKDDRDASANTFAWVFQP